MQPPLPLLWIGPDGYQNSRNNSINDGWHFIRIVAFGLSEWGWFITLWEVVPWPALLAYREISAKDSNFRKRIVFELVEINRLGSRGPDARIERRKSPLERESRPENGVVA